MRKNILALVFLGVSSCSSLGGHWEFNNHEKIWPANETGQVDIYYDSPKVDYETIGFYYFKGFRAGFTTPSLTRFIPQIKQECAKKGADAIIFRDANRVGFSQRSTLGTVEAIKYKK